MSILNKYTKKVNDIAKTTFTNYLIAESDLELALEAKQNWPRKDIENSEYTASRAKAEADHAKAAHALEEAKNDMAAKARDIEKLRGDLEAELNGYYATDPEALDANALELLKSGILDYNDYEKLLSKYNNNHTMVRLIADYADKAADGLGKKYGNSDPRYLKMRALALVGKKSGKTDALEKFDLMADVYNRTVANTGMISKWKELVGHLIEED